MLDKYRYVFVLTYGRSGSTLLMKILNQCPGVEIRGENHNILVHLFRAICAARRTHAEHGFRDKGSDDPWFGASKIETDRLARHLLDGFVADVLAPSAETKVTGFKEIRCRPPHMKEDEFQTFVTFLLDTFPGARIVFNTRAAEQVANSGWFKKMDPAAVHDMVTTSDLWFNRFAQTHDGCFIIDYADMIANESRVAEMMQFLNLDHDAGVVDDVLSVPLTHVKKPSTAGSDPLRWLKRQARRLLR